MDEQVAAVEQALATLYTNPDPAQKKVAEKWLSSVRTSPQAWGLGWVLLQPERCLESQFFGANAILAKVSGVLFFFLKFLLVFVAFPSSTQGSL